MIQVQGFTESSRDSIYYGDFPKTFSWGTCTSAYQVIFYKLCKEIIFNMTTMIIQVEGGWQADGKGASIWDTFTATLTGNSAIADGSDGKIACDSYSRIVDDIKILKELRASMSF